MAPPGIGKKLANTLMTKIVMTAAISRFITYTTSPGSLVLGYSVSRQCGIQPSIDCQLITADAKGNYTQILKTVKFSAKKCAFWDGSAGQSRA